MIDKISQNAIGRALGLTSAAMVKMKKKGCPMDSVEVVRAWRKSNQNIVFSKPEPKFAAPPGHAREIFHEVPQGHKPPADYAACRAQREAAEAGMAELKLAEMKGELIRVDAVKRVMALSFATTRDGLLQIPARMAAVLAAESDPATVQRLMYAEIHRALVVLSTAGERIGETK